MKYGFYVEYNDRKMDFDVKLINILVVRQFQVVYSFHRDDNLDAKQEFVHYLPMERRKEKAFECEQIINIIQKNLHLEDKVHMLVYEYFA